MHTPFCPHGTKDVLESYIEVALKDGRKELTFTEHFPMPEGVTTPQFRRECTLLKAEVSEYIAAVKQVRNIYKEKIKIYLGFEVDYIEGYEKEVQVNLERYGKEMEDGILSVHFIKFQDKYYAIDYLPDFEALLNKTQSLEKIYEIYYETILKSIHADLGEYKPKRIGHATLVRIFNKRYPTEYQNIDLFKKIILALKENKYEVDFNIAGLRKDRKSVV